jgi:hypothetical protein
MVTNGWTSGKSKRMCLSMAAFAPVAEYTDPPTPNTLPIADAGNGQTVSVCKNVDIASVELDGSGSTDADGDELKYFWFIGYEQIATGVNPPVELGIGEYLIELIVNDGRGNSEPDEVAVTVVGPMELLDILGQNLIDLELQKGIENSLVSKLDTVLKKLEDDNENNDVASINSLESFINAVQAQRGKKISEADADVLIAAAQKIIELLSCG